MGDNIKPDVYVGTWIPSRYNVAADLPDGRRAVFNLLSGQVEVVDTGTWQKCLKPGAKYRVPDRGLPEIVRDLHLRSFTVPSDLDELDIVKLHFQAERFDTTRQQVVISPTLDCNMRCPYCFVGGVQETRDLTPMSVDTQDQVVRYLTGLCETKKTLSISWFGGEPLMSLDAIERITSGLYPFLSRQNINYAASVTTNATLLTLEVARKLKQLRIISVQATVDVPQSVKRYRGGRVVPWQRILAGAATAANQGIEVALRVNVSENTESELDALYAILIECGLHKQLDAIYWSGVLAVECGRSNYAACGPTGRQLYNMMQHERAKARTLGLPIRPLISEQPGRPCGASCVSYVCIGPQGRLYRCPTDFGITERSHGSVWDDQPLEMSKLLSWLTYDWFAIDQCLGCPVQPMCGGGCPHRRLHMSGRQEADDFCVLTRWALEDGSLQQELRDYVLANEAAADQKTRAAT